MSSGLPLRLAASAPTWEREVDVVVVGSGAAGLAAALAARPVRHALIVTKGTLDAGSTAWAQGGLAGVLDPADTLEDHVARHPGRRRRAVRRGRGARARRRGAQGDSLPDATRRGVRPGRQRCDRPRPHPRGRAQPQPHRPRRGRPQRRRGAADPGRVGDGGRRRGAQPRLRPRPRRRHVARRCPSGGGRDRRPARRRRPRHVGRHDLGAGHRPRHRRLGPGLRLDLEPAGGHRRRCGDGVARRAGRQRRRVRAVPPDRAVDRARRGRPAGAGQRGGARRGRGALRRRRRPGDGGRPPARRPRPSRRRGGGDQPAHGAGTGGHRRPRVPRRHPPRDRASPSASRPSTPPAERSASIRPTIASRSPPPPTTRAAACRPASTAPPHSTASTRWGRCRGPGCTAPTGWRRTASPRGSSPAPASGATWPGSCPTAPRPQPTAPSPPPP